MPAIPTTTSSGSRARRARSSTPAIPTTMPAVSVTTSKARPPGGQREPPDGVLGRTDQGQSGEEHDDAGGDDRGGLYVDVEGQEEHGDARRERGSGHLLEEQRQTPPVQHPQHLLD